MALLAASVLPKEDLQLVLADRSKNEPMATVQDG
jgi:hypothetical protein